MSDFSNYDLGEPINALADGLLPEMARAFEYELAENPSIEDLQGLVGHIGPAKTLQDNIAGVQARLGVNADGVTIAADWVERSGSLNLVDRAFSAPVQRPESVDAVVWSGGVANWILRRTILTERLDPDQVGKVVIAAGARSMGEAEHQLVKTYAKSEGKLPTESDFVRGFVLPRLDIAGFTADVVHVESAIGDEVLDAVFATDTGLLDGTILNVGNAPNVVQSAGQLRLAARRAQPGFDANGDQLFMVGDTIQVARHGEGTATHQNPFSALGQIARNALILRQNQLS